MRASRLAEAPDQDRIRCFKEPQFGLNTGLSLQLLKDCGKVRKTFSLAHVDDDGRFCGLAFGFQNEFVKLGEKADGKIVDAIEPAIFKRLEKCSFSRAAQSSDDEE